MLTFKKGGYNKQELTIFHKALTEMVCSKTLSDHCKQAPNCEKCPTKKHL